MQFEKKKNTGLYAEFIFDDGLQKIWFLFAVT